MKSEEDFEFEITDAQLEFDNPPKVNRVIFETPDVPGNRITAKLRKEVEKETEEAGMPGTYTEEEMYDADELPGNVEVLVKKAQEEEFTAVATVSANEDNYYFILDRDIETLDARLLQDDR
jgi:hypothetical protein